MTVAQMAGDTTIISSGAAGGRQLLAHRGQVADAAATAAELLGHGDAEIAELAGLRPQLGGLLAGSRLGREVVAAEPGGQVPNRGPQRLPLLGFRER